MPFFGRRRNYDTTGYGHGHSGRNNHGTAYGPGPSHHRAQGGFFHRKDPDRVVGGYKAALANPNTTREGREHAKHELHAMGHSAHVPLMTKIKRTLGIRSTPRRNINHRNGDFYN